MTCREFTEFLDAYLADEVAEQERERFDRHLSVCTDCVNYLASYRKTLKLTREALSGPDERVPEQVPDRLVAAVMTAIGKDSVLTPRNHLPQRPPGWKLG